MPLWSLSRRQQASASGNLLPTLQGTGTEPPVFQGGGTNSPVAAGGRDGVVGRHFFFWGDPSALSGEDDQRRIGGLVRVSTEPLQKLLAQDTGALLGQEGEKQREGGSRGGPWEKTCGGESRKLPSWGAGSIVA